MPATCLPLEGCWHRRPVTPEERNAKNCLSVGWNGRLMVNNRTSLVERLQIWVPNMLGVLFRGDTVHLFTFSVLMATVMVCLWGLIVSLFGATLVLLMLFVAQVKPGHNLQTWLEQQKASMWFVSELAFGQYFLVGAALNWASMKVYHFVRPVVNVVMCPGWTVDL